MVFGYFFLKSTNGKTFWVFDRNLSWLFLKKMQTSAFLRPLPPRVCKRLQLSTPSPLKIADVLCGRPLVHFYLSELIQKIQFALTDPVASNSTIDSTKTRSFLNQTHYFQQLSRNHWSDSILKINTYLNKQKRCTDCYWKIYKITLLTNLGKRNGILSKWLWNWTR